MNRRLLGLVLALLPGALFGSAASGVAPWLYPSPPTNGQTWVYNSTDKAWEPGTNGPSLPIPISSGGTGATTAAGAVVALTPATVSNTEAGGTFTLSWTAGPTQTLTLNANLTSVTFSGAYDGATVVVYVTNTASNYTVTWGNSIKWPGGSQPTQTVGAHTDRWVIQDVGGVFYGSVTQNY